MLYTQPLFFSLWSNVLGGTFSTRATHQAKAIAIRSVEVNPLVTQINTNFKQRAIPLYPLLYGSLSLVRSVLWVVGVRII